MKLFEIYTPDNAPSPSDNMLGGVKKMLGFVPNVFAVMGGTPPVLGAFATMKQKFSETSLSAIEREIINIATSVENVCVYCVAGHTSFAKSQKVPDDVIAAVRTRGTINDPKLAALHDFVRAVVIGKGHIEQSDMDRFLSAGYAPSHVQEVILGVCTKTFSNLTSNLLGIPLDAVFEPHAWHPSDAVVELTREQQVV